MTSPAREPLFRNRSCPFTLLQAALGRAWQNDAREVELHEICTRASGVALPNKRSPHRPRSSQVGRQGLEPCPPD